MTTLPNNLRTARVAATSLWTIGHSTRTIDEFVNILRHYEIEILVDVRHFPSSRRFPHFDKDELRVALVSNGIRYEHLVALGGRRVARPGSRNVAWRNASFRGYADHMETQEFRGGIARLMQLASVGRTAIMCSEAVWWRCHRSIVADYLKASGVQVSHILSMTKIQVHPFTSAARLVDGRLSYVGIVSD